eukprot:scaffold3086_cov75-Cylindrotheca_fusiformis.AAC.6
MNLGWYMVCRVSPYFWLHPYFRILNGKTQLWSIESENKERTEMPTGTDDSHAPLKNKKSK